MFVTEALKLGPIAADLRRAGGDELGVAVLWTLSPAELSAEERTALRTALEKAGVQEELDALNAAIHFDERRKSSEPGRQGAPARHWLRTEVLALFAAIERRSVDCDRRKVAALLVMLVGLDQHRVLWRTDGAPPPLGRARVAWVAKRLSHIAAETTGQYAVRKAAKKR